MLKHAYLCLLAILALIFFLKGFDAAEQFELYGSGCIML